MNVKLGVGDYIKLAFLSLLWVVIFICFYNFFGGTESVLWFLVKLVSSFIAATFVLCVFVNKLKIK